MEHRLYESMSIELYIGCQLMFSTIIIQQVMSDANAPRAQTKGKPHRNLKFSFSDYGFSHFVRARMTEILNEFDTSGNSELQQDQIKRALVQILDEDPQQVHYVVKNVFRYDRDNDGKISHKQFINFSVEQHFGEMAIQRLHREKLYSQGAKRIMNLTQFAHTMEFSLNTIGVYGSNQIYQTLFHEIDLDKDGWISYEDYFTFLREYFGSLQQQAEPTPEPVRPPVPDFVIDNGAGERFARLIYAQQKITAMQVDVNKNLYLQATEVELFLTQIMQTNDYEKDHISKLILKEKTQVSYEEFLQFIVPFYYCEYFVSQRLGNLGNTPINEQLFVDIITEASGSFVAVSPSEKTIKSIFHLATGGATDLTLEQYVMLMGNIFENYSFDKRGLARGSAH